MKRQLEILFTRAGAQFIAYAPLAHVVFMVNSHTKDFISKLIAGQWPTSPDAEQTNVITKLQAAGVFDSQQPVRTPTQKINQLTLLLTRNCNLRCKYCFSEGGHVTTEMPVKIALAAIDYMLGVQGNQSVKSFSLSFLGGGEPTKAWGLLLRSSNYAIDKCRRAGITCRLGLTSNCLWTKEQTDWIKSHIGNLTASFDGPKDITAVVGTV